MEIKQRNQILKACSFLRMAADEFEAAGCMDNAQRVRGFAERCNPIVEQDSAEIIVFPNCPDAKPIEG